ncbi:MAG TPA: alpha-amylase family protein [Nocardioides sp.]|uniref:alpha-amylase family protein n=1 Tax=Nocardioides sp. TaxID=35761 RepID=UPI002C64027A|nr:alpha-amylase family protein [Nocardioides sp.]HQR28710.1 alpha-amylase family protein [Nocardioides sp.]
MSWIDHVLWWHVYPLGALGAPRENHGEPVVHRLAGLEPWLDYAVDLGANGLQLGPVFASSTHGYDTLDHFRIDPRLGDDADFDRLVEDCRARGLRLLLDGVFNHVGADHPSYRRALAEGPAGELADLFALDWSDPAAPRCATFEGHADLVELNHAAPRTADLVAGVMDHWLDRGVDGWRLDAAYAVDPAFWARVLPRVRAGHPDALFVGEVIHGDYPDVVARSGLDSVTQYELWKAVWSSLHDRNLFELSWALERHNGFVERFVPMTFVGNHDVTRIATLVGDAGAALALVVLGTVGGMPSLYYGDEQAFRGVKTERVGGDDEIRPPLPARPEELAEEGRWMYRVHQQVLGLRRRHPWLVRARTSVVSLANERLVYRSRAASGDGLLTVELDLTGAARAVVRTDERVELTLDLGTLAR